MIRIARVAFALLALAGCKKRPQPTVPAPPDAQQMAGVSNLETAESTLFHTMYRYAGHAGEALRFYQPEMQKRGAAPSGDGFADGNVEHAGGFGRDGSAGAKDPSRPGVWLSVLELGNETRIDIWENVPNPK